MKYIFSSGFCILLSKPILMKHYLLCFSLLFCVSVRAQIEYPYPIKKWSLQQFKLAGGYNAYSPLLTDYSSISQLAKSSSDLSIPSDIASFNRRGDSQQGSLGNLALWASAGFSPGKPTEKSINTRRLLQLSLGYQDVSTLEAAYSINQKIFSTPDSSLSRDYFVFGRQRAVMLEGAYLFRTDVERAVYAYGGVGLQLGMSFSSVLEENTNRSFIFTTSDSSATTFIPNISEIKGVPYFNTGLVLPFGAHARIYKNWGAVADFRYVFGFTQAIGGASFTRSYLQATLGISYTLGKFPERKPEDEIEEF